MVFITVVAGFAAILAASAILRGWVLSYLWAWFIVPLGVPAISVSWAIGISILVAMLTQRAKIDDTSDEPPAERMAKAFGLMLFAPTLALAIGWIVHNIMIG